MIARKAPYLDDVPSLPDEVIAALAAKRPNAALIARARRTIDRLRQLIRRARTRYEIQLGHAIYVTDVLEEDQSQDNMLILRRVHIVAELFRRGPKRGFETQVGA